MIFSGSHLYALKPFFRLLLIWAFFLLLWVTFVFQVTLAELIAGAAAAGLATLAIGVTLRAEPLCFHPQLRWSSQGARLPGMIATDLWLLSKDLRRLVRRKSSQSELVSTSLVFESDKCKAAAQRAFAVLFVSMSPNSVVVDLDRETHLMLVHNLRPAPIPPLVRRLQE